ncbi:MAG: hypothetical protein AB7E49_01880 [Campylobacterales bacterium]
MTASTAAALETLAAMLNQIAIEARQDEGFVDTPGAAAYLGKSESWVKLRMREGDFTEGREFWRRGGSIFFAKQALREWVQSGSPEEMKGGQSGKHLRPTGQTLREFVQKRTA